MVLTSRGKIFWLWQTFNETDLKIHYLFQTEIWKLFRKYCKQPNIYLLQGLLPMASILQEAGIKNPGHPTSRPTTPINRPVSQPSTPSNSRPNTPSLTPNKGKLQSLVFVCLGTTHTVCYLLLARAPHFVGVSLTGTHMIIDLNIWFMFYITCRCSKCDQSNNTTRKRVTINNSTNKPRYLKGSFILERKRKRTFSLIFVAAQCKHTIGFSFAPI